MTDECRLVLLVEDNEQIMTGNKRYLERQGFDTAVALTLAEARTQMERRRPDVVVLDIMLPDGSGLDFMVELRKGEDPGIPVLLLTGLTAKQDIVRGLKAGGDDYLTKPYDFSELLARIEALLRRSARVPKNIVKGALSLDVAAGTASLNGIDLRLTKKDFALLLIFFQNEGSYINMESLYERAWKAPLSSDKSALYSSVKRLRAKIKGSGWSIGQSRDEGYIFERE
ncbi:MAG: response regulator transcription factor [Oscillospiraceae bacterium]|jgi:DNA-binding response OmpR family regulator|nr:response regulator transcription factor [Oscillospiraceae bacterium]